MTSTCDGVAKLCVGQGPGKDDFDSTKIIANKLFKKASVSNINTFNKILILIIVPYM